MQNLGAFRGFTEWTLKVYLRIGLESVIELSNSCDLAWIELKSKPFRLEVSIFRKLALRRCPPHCMEIKLYEIPSDMCEICKPCCSFQPWYGEQTV